MLKMNLTPNAVRDINDGKTVDSPIVQILNVKKINTQNADPSKPDRYRLHISDGTSKHPSAMLATQLNHLVENGDLKKNSVMRLRKYICNDVGNRRIIIILAADIVAGDVEEVIGNPVQVGVGGEEASAQPSHAAASVSTTVKAPSTSFASSHNTAPYGGAQSARPHQPISSLNPYNPRWCIRARVTAKTDVKEWNNARGSGKLFSVDLLDDSSELRATAFNSACEKLHPILEVGKVYFIKGGRIKPANKKFTSIKNDYELNLDDNTVVTLDSSDTGVPQQKFEFVPFRELESMSCEGTFVDVLAVVKDVSPTATITTKTTKKDITKRDVQLMDSDAITLSCTLWGKEAENFESDGGAVGTVVAIKKARLSDFSGRSLSVSSTSQLVINPDIPEAHSLKGWYDNGGHETETKTLTVKSSASSRTPTILISQIKDDKIGQLDRPEYFTVKGAVTYIRKENCVYQACPSADCNKKVIEESPGSYRCEKCNRSTPNFKWRLMTSFSFNDASGQQWITSFQETAEIVLGKNAEEIGHMKENDEAAFDQAIARATFKPWMVTCRAKSEIWNDEARTRVTAVRIGPIDYVQECRRLIDEIKLYA